MREAQHHGGTTFRAQLRQHYPQSRRPLGRVQIPVEVGQRLQLFVIRSLVDVDVGGPPALDYRVFLYEIVRDRIKIRDGLADRLLITDSEHAQIHLLHQVRSVGFAPDASTEKRLQRSAVLAEQALD